MNKRHRRAAAKNRGRQIPQVRVSGSVDNQLGASVSCYRAGKLSEAKLLCAKVLSQEPKNVTALHLLGVIKCQEGDALQATELIRQVIALQPDDAEAHNNMGIALSSQGKLEEAVAAYHSALELKPDYAEAHNNLGIALKNQGKLEEAAAAYHRALELKPDYVEAHNNLGIALKNQDQPEEAVASYRNAIAIKPDYAEAHNNLGNVLKNQGKLEEAVAAYHRALELKPDYAEAHNNLGIALKNQGKLEQAVAAYNRTLELKPDYVEAHNNLGIALKNQDQLEEAVASYRKALAIKPDYAEAHYNLGNVLTKLGQSEETVASYRKAIAIKPDYAEAHNNLGIEFTNLGRLAEAVASYRKALAIKPDYAEAHLNMARIKKHSDYGNDIKAMEEEYANPENSDEQKMYLAFGLGKAFEDLREYETAFDFFLAGNTMKRKTQSYSIDTQDIFFGKQKEVFDRSWFDKYQGAGCEDDSPIFIVGMLRSGTTLVEQILASHSQVYGAGEVLTLSQIVVPFFNSFSGAAFAESIRECDVAEFERMGIEYIDAIKKHSKKARFVTDKMLSNFHFIGLIKLILPNAKIIHCCRNPLDNCLSIFKCYFSNNALGYAYDLIELGEYYNIYRDLMKHWHSVLPDFIYDIQYEEMVADQAEQTRLLLKHCGLEWEDACLEFYKTDRPVRTASAEQVRRPIYKDSVRSWKRYEKQLAPLLEILG